MAVLSQKAPIELHTEHSEVGNMLPAIEENTGEGQNKKNNERIATESPRLVLPAVKAVSGLRSPGTSSTESLTHLLGHSEKTQPTVKSKIKDLRSQVQLAFEELNAITTHDDNLEKQYKETVDENVKLTMSLERARREIRHLRGQLSILQMTQKEIREEKARKEKSYNQQMQYDKDIQGSRQKFDVPPILSLQERSRTVNAQGKYIEHSKKKSEKGHRRHTTYPVAGVASPQRKALQEALPPPLSGCNCSMCNAVQSLGALTLSGSSGSMAHQKGHVSSSGQQILRGDRVIIKGEKPGTVKYIGRLEGSMSNDVYIGIQLDAPVGFNDGEFKGRQYFHCAPNHGVFIMPSDVICVVSRRVQKTPKGNKERLLTSNEILNRSRNKSGKGDVKMRFQTRDDDGRITITPSVYSIDEKMNEMTRAAYLMEEELKKVPNRNPGFVGSSADMSRRIETLHTKNKKKGPHQPTTVTMSPKPSASPAPVHSTQSPAPSTQSPKQPSSPVPVHTAQSLAPPRPSSPVAKALNESPTSGSKKLPADAETDEPNPQALLTELLLEVLREKDLGTTGYVTIKEFVNCIASCDIEGLGKLTESEAEELLTSLGIESDAGAGIAYDEVAPYVVNALM
ncbi:centrosome-associated protein 350-like [Dysidea avara]|uniref:centrosome-associated protein 350-like n=1 Tax=Dysidea avara TaxID=196820 RepID=UPI00332DF547